ncbi:hypothetical protein EDEG_00704 [Edhazardia aedis USNM 41457]|uniref:Signal recognition particle receptor subunit beta n=1 Tax=Edhazardia aedis (strain USNM 41457) TaxID=1003232 RepID=J9DCP8_EDHAE|nr:hypothetical protein EDEG_00704 [Edhazardia aedis USNM 41457]|eukprot:EJW05239.1 hypothetical protein EDEG_00704 [Edhazardia aedis USNM 41457]
MFLFLILLLLSIVSLIYLLILKRNKQVYKFVGPSGGGKTFTLHKLLGNNQIKTVPSLEDNIVETKRAIIHDLIPNENGESFIETYKLDYNCKSKYFFFFNDPLDIVDFEGGLDIMFVYRKQKESLKGFPIALSNKLIILNGETSNLNKFISL